MAQIRDGVGAHHGNEEGSDPSQVDSVFALEDFEAAFARLEQRGKRGKVVLSVSCS